MKILFIADPLNTFKKDHDSTYALMLAGFEMACSIFYASPQDLIFKRSLQADLDVLDAKFFDFEVSSKSNLISSIPERVSGDLESFDVIFIRKDPPFDENYLQLTQLLSKLKKPLIINSPEALRTWNEKLSILEFPELTAPTIVTANKIQAKEFLEQHKRIVIKPLNAKGGEGVYKLSVDSSDFDEIWTLLSADKFFVMLQAFIDDVFVGDKRIIMMNGKPYGATLRIPPQGSFRANMAAGGSCAKTILSDRDNFICDTLGPWLIKQGIYFAGIDVIGQYLTEINITSPTCLQEINRLEGLSGESKLESRFLREISNLRKNVIA